MEQSNNHIGKKASTAGACTDAQIFMVLGWFINLNTSGTWAGSFYLYKSNSNPKLISPPQGIRKSDAPKAHKWLSKSPLHPAWISQDWKQFPDVYPPQITISQA